MFRLFKFFVYSFILLNLLIALPVNAADETLQFDKVSKQLTAIEKKLKPETTNTVISITM